MLMSLLYIGFFATKDVNVELNGMGKPGTHGETGDVPWYFRFNRDGTMQGFRE